MNVYTLAAQHFLLIRILFGSAKSPQNNHIFQITPLKILSPNSVTSEVLGIRTLTSTFERNVVPPLALAMHYFHCLSFHLNIYLVSTRTIDDRLEAENQRLMSEM